MANNEHLFPQEQFQPILERSMALDGLLPADEICLAFKDIKAIWKSRRVMATSTKS